MDGWVLIKRNIYPNLCQVGLKVRYITVLFFDNKLVGLWFNVIDNCCCCFCLRKNAMYNLREMHTILGQCEGQTVIMGFYSISFQKKIFVYGGFSLGVSYSRCCGEMPDSAQRLLCVWVANISWSSKSALSWLSMSPKTSSVGWELAPLQIWLALVHHEGQTQTR